MLAGAVGGVWELALRGLTEDADSSIADLAGPAIYLLLAPFVGRRQAAARAAGRGGDDRLQRRAGRRQSSATPTTAACWSPSSRGRR